MNSHKYENSPNNLNVANNKKRRTHNGDNDDSIR